MGIPQEELRPIPGPPLQAASGETERMFNLSNILFIFIAVAIFISRTIVQARKKQAPPPRIPVHFEDDEDPEYFKRTSAAKETASGSTVKTARPKQSLNLQAALSSSSITESKVKSAAFNSGDTGIYNAPSGTAIGPKTATARNAGAAGVSPARSGFALNLNHLSPMKQAVVMAEVLGPPKGML